MTTLARKCDHSLRRLDFIDFDFGTRHSQTPPDIVTVHQIHSALVVSNHGMPPRPHDSRLDADALLENTPGVSIGVRTADCVPILLADPVQQAVAAVHAGWRGTAASIVQASIRFMADEFGTRPQDLHAAIGPSIGPCCYQVGPDVAKEFGVLAAGKVHLDLSYLNARQLESAGVPEQNISNDPNCTQCNPNDYYSFRRDREAAGRMLSWIRIKRRC
jgi:YfiH family protein